MNRDIDDALAMGEDLIAKTLLDELLRTTRAATPSKVLAVLRARAQLAFESGEDDDMDALAEVAKKHGEVTSHDGHGVLDLDALAWAEAMAAAPREAKKALEDAESVAAPGDAPVLAVTRAALLYAATPTDASRDALVATLARVSKTHRGGRLERVVRLLVQRQLHSGAQLARELVAVRKASHPAWSREVARAIDLRVAAVRVDADGTGADDELASWIDACEVALPNPRDPRRAAIDARRETSGKGALFWRARRVERVSRRFGESSPLLEPALRALSADAKQAGEHAVAVDALRRLDTLLKRKASGTKALIDRACVLVDLRRAYIGLGRTDEALDVVLREEEVRRGRGLPVPDHLARAEVLFAAGDLAGYVDRHLAELARCEAGTGPQEGPKGSDTRLARGWARMALVRVGRKQEAFRLVD